MYFFLLPAFTGVVLAFVRFEQAVRDRVHQALVCGVGIDMSTLAFLRAQSIFSSGSKARAQLELPRTLLLHPKIF